MDLNSAVATHAKWKILLRSAIYKQEDLNADSIAQDDLCELGKWLHDDAKTRFGHLPSYADCVTAHAAFHAEAARVAREINAKRFSVAERMLDQEMGYALASSSVTAAIIRLKAEAALVEA